MRAAAGRLAVNHSTVLRRVAQLEQRLGAQMFEKLPTGYRLTEAGEDVLDLATQMEASSHQLETRVFGRDRGVRGLLRVTLTPPLAAHLLMPDFVDFARLHPDIEMEILSSGELANITNREADVAIRVVYDRKTLPLNLHGLKGPGAVRGRLHGARSPSRVACGGAGSRPVDRHQHAWDSGLGQRGRGSLLGGSIQDYRCRGPNRRCEAGARDDGTAVFHGRSRSAAGEGAGHRSAHARIGLASYTGRNTQNHARSAFHGVHIPQACRLRSASGGGGCIAQLTLDCSPSTLGADQRLLSYSLRYAGSIGAIRLCFVDKR